MNLTPRNDKHQHVHHVGRDGRVWVTRSVSRCRKNNQFRATDWLTVPFLARPATLARVRDLTDQAWALWRTTTWATWTGTDAEREAITDAAQRWDVVLDRCRRAAE